ncbi:chromosome partitioning protein [Kitasatospora sp. MAP5-34]|nr:chromosome partitioning protein [Kitasatospora sp. MAP5-34]
MAVGVLPALIRRAAMVGVSHRQISDIAGMVFLVKRRSLLSGSFDQRLRRGLGRIRAVTVAAPVSRETLTPMQDSETVDQIDDTPMERAAQAAVRAVGVAGEALPRPAATRVIVVANQKGGVGKTTTTVNMAAALAMHGLRVLVVDLDPQGNASTALGIDHHAEVPSIYDVLVEGKPLADVVQPVVDVEGLFCVPATIDLAGAEIELVSMVARETRLQRAITAYEQPLDYILIDCPPSLGLLTVNALVAGQEVLIPIQCEYYALEGLGQLLRNVELVRAHLNQTLHVSTILLTMFDARTRLAAQVADEVRTHFSEEVLATAIPRSVRISEAPSYGQTVLTYDPGSTGALSYLEAARELALRAVVAPDAAVGHGSVGQQRSATGAPDAPMAQHGTMEDNR